MAASLVTTRWNNAVLMLGQRRRRWANIKTSLFQRVVVAGNIRCGPLSIQFSQHLRILKTPTMVLAGGDFPLTWCWTVANYPSEGQMWAWSGRERGSKSGVEYKTWTRTGDTADGIYIVEHVHVYYWYNVDCLSIFKTCTSLSVIRFVFYIFISSYTRI